MLVQQNALAHCVSLSPRACRYFGGGQSLAQFQPKNALRRAREFMKVGRVQDACEVLHNAISKRGRTVVWTPEHEEMTLEFINLCVELRDPRRAKDGMYHYRQLAQTQGACLGAMHPRSAAPAPLA